MVTASPPEERTHPLGEFTSRTRAPMPAPLGLEHEHEQEQDQDQEHDALLLGSPRRGLPTNRQLLSILLAAVLLTAAIVVAMVVLATGSPFQAQITNTYPAGESSVAVSVTVTNSSGVPARPTCQVDLASPGRILTGIGVTGVGSFAAGGPIPAGGSWGFSGLVSVTDGPPDAVTVGASSVTCR